MFDANDVEAHAAGLPRRAGLCIAWGNLTWLGLARLSRLRELSAVLLALFLASLLTILLVLPLGLASLSILLTVLLVAGLALVVLRALLITLLLLALGLSLTALARLRRPRRLFKLPWLSTLTPLTFEPAGGLLQGLQEVAVILDHHLGEFLDLFALGLLLGEFRQFDLTLIVDQQPVRHDMCAMISLLLTLSRSPLLDDARLAGPSRLARQRLARPGRLARQRLTGLSRLHLSLLNRRRLLRVGSPHHHHAHGERGEK
jgi:hypothetical protein